MDNCVCWNYLIVLLFVVKVMDGLLMVYFSKEFMLDLKIIIVYKVVFVFKMFVNVLNWRKFFLIFMKLFVIVFICVLRFKVLYSILNLSIFEGDFCIVGKISWIENEI